MDKWTKIPDQTIIGKTIEALRANNINALVVENKEEAKRKVLEIIPEGAEVMTMTSATLDSIGIPPEINESRRYSSIRNKLNSLDRATQSLQMQKLGSAPQFVVGSVNAITQDGKVLIASNTGSQLSAYVYGSENVIWVIGAQKIVKDFDEAIERIYEYVLPLESKRVQKAYGMPQSAVNKLLVINKEVKPNRMTAIIVKGVLGF